MSSFQAFSFYVDVINSVLTVLVYAVIGLFNPFDSFGPGYWNVNIWSGLVIIPCGNIGKELSIHNLILQEFEWDDIRVQFSIFPARRIVLTINGLKIGIRPQVNRKDNLTNNSDMSTSDVQSKLSSGKSFFETFNSFQLPWWSQFLPSIRFELGKSPQLAVALSNDTCIVLLTKEVIFDIGVKCPTKDDPGQISFGISTTNVFLCACDINVNEVAMHKESNLSTPFQEHISPCYLGLTSGIVELMLIPRGRKSNAQEAVPSDHKISLNIDLGSVTALTDFDRSDLLCAIIHDIVAVLTSSFTGCDWPQHQTYERFRSHSRSSQDEFFRSIDRLCALTSHRMKTPGRMPAYVSDSSSLSSSSSLVGSMSSVEIVFLCSINQVALSASVAVLSAVQPLERKGRQRTLRRPKVVVQENRKRDKYRCKLLDICNINVSISGTTLRPEEYCCRLEICIGSIESFVVGDELRTGASYAGSPLFKLQAEVHSTSMVGLFVSNSGFEFQSKGTFHVSCNPLTLSVDASVLSQTIRFIGDCTSAAHASCVPSVFRSSNRRHLQQYFQSNSAGGQISNDILGSLNDFGGFPSVYWETFCCNFGDFCLRVTDERYQFTNRHQSILELTVDSPHIKVVAYPSALLASIDVPMASVIDGDDVMWDTRSEENELVNITAYNKYIVQFGKIRLRNACVNDRSMLQAGTQSKYCGDFCFSADQDTDIENILLLEGFEFGYESRIVGNAYSECNSLAQLPILFRRQLHSSSGTTPINDFENRDADFDCNGEELASWCQWIDHSRKSVAPHRQETKSIHIETITICLNQYHAAALTLCIGALKSHFKPAQPEFSLPLQLVDMNIFHAPSEIIVNSNIRLGGASFVLNWYNLDEIENRVFVEDSISLQMSQPCFICTEDTSSIAQTTSIFLSETIRVLRKHINEVDNAFIEITPRKSECFFRSVRYPVKAYELAYMHRDTGIKNEKCIVQYQSTQRLSLGNISAKLDRNSFDVFFRLQGRCAGESSYVTNAMNAIQNGRSWAKFVPLEPFEFRRDCAMHPHRLFGQASHEDDKKIRKVSPTGVLTATILPSAVFLVDIGTIGLDFEQDRQSLVFISMNSFVHANISFGPNLSHVCGGFSSFKILDKLLPSSIHAYIINNIDSSASMSNKVEYHLSSLRGECSLLEIRTAFLRVVYLQRPVMAYVMYFRDYFFPAFGKAFLDEFADWVGRNGYEDVTGPINPLSRSQRTPLGQFRFTAELINSEAHIPTNSRGTDCLTAIFPRLRLFKGGEELDKSYCMGPNLLHGIWLSQLDYVLSLAGLKKFARKQRSDKHRRCATPSLITFLVAPESEFRQVKLFRLDIECENATLCSWCNRNEIGSRININCFVTFGPVPPAPDAMYAEVFKSQGFIGQPANNKNMVVVDISTEEVDWTITQGQYTAIVYLIQQNIPEIQLVVKDINEQPVNKLVHLRSEVFGKYSMERRLPMINTVPIHIKSGRLTAVDNEPEYYDYLSRLLSAVNSPSGGYLADNDRFPEWSHHHIHQEALFSGCSLDDDNFWHIVSQRHRKPPVNDRRPFSFDDPTLSSSDHATIIRIYFKRLEIDFFRLHYGGGAGIDVSAGTFIIVSSKFDNISSSTADDNDAASVASIDLDEIQPETIIFAPKTLPQLRKSLVSSTSGYKSHRNQKLNPYARRRPTLSTPMFDSPLAAAAAATLLIDRDSDGPRIDLNDDDYFSADEAEPPSRNDDAAVDEDVLGDDNGGGVDVETDGIERGIIDSKVSFCPSTYTRTTNRIDSDDEGGDEPAFSWHGDSSIHRGSEESNIGNYVPQIRYRQQGVANLRRCIVDISESVLIAHIRPIMAAVSYFVDPVTLNDLRGQALMSQEGFGPFDFKAGLDVEVHSRSTVIAVPKLSSEEAMSVLCIQSDLDYTHAFRGFKNAGPAIVTIKVDFSIFSVFIAPVHEIQVTGSESLVEPCTIHFGSDWQVHSAESALNENLVAVAPHIDVMCLPKKVSKYDNPVAKRYMSFKVSSILDKDDVVARDSDYRRTIITRQTIDSEVAQLLKLKFSLKDISFIIAAGEQLKQSWICRRQQSPLPQRFSFLFDGKDAFNDILHLSRPTFQNIYVPMVGNLLEGDLDVVVDCCNIDIVLKNNTYNLKIAKGEVTNFNLSYSKAFDRLHMATGLTLSAWTFNENADTWEPIIESTGGSCIAATDTSLNSTASADVAATGVTIIPPVRYDVFCNPVCINAPESTTVNLIRKFSLADVITTSSIHLPPYRVINELGVPVVCSLSIGSLQLYESEVSVGNFLPIERRDIAKASISSRRHALQRYKSSTASSGTNHFSDNDHKLGLTFTLDMETFSCKDPLSIDREGIFAYDMKPVAAKAKSRSILRLPSFSLAGNAVESVGISAGNTDSTGVVTVNIAGGTTMISNSAQISRISKQQTMRVGYNLPYTLVSMRIKDDGGRELVLRSCLSLKNLSNRHLYISIRRGSLVAETQLTPGAEWNVPIQLAHPKSSLFIRRNDRSPWFEVSAALGSLILQGVWGAPTRLKAEIVSCPPDISTLGCKEMNWVLLLKPEVRDTKGGSGNALGSRTFIPVRYPAKDTPKQKGESAEFLAGASGLSGGTERVDSGDNLKAFDEVYSLGFSSSSARSIIAQPMCIQLIAPLQLCNLLSQPLLYRVADNDGLVVAEGVLVPGEVIDLHAVYQIFAKRVFLSIRVLNYCWSKWTKILSKNNPFPANEKTLEMSLTSMDISHQGEDIQFPALDVVLHMREHIIRISCPIIIRNCTGVQLDISESNSLDSYIPHSTQPPIEASVALKIRSSGQPMSSEQQEISRTLLPKAAPRTIEPEMVNNEALIPTATDSKTAEDEDSDDEFKDYAVSDEVEIIVGDDFGADSPARKLTKGYSVPRPVNSVILLSVHLPFDHMSKLEIAASPDWTLANVFSKLSPKLSVNKQFRGISSYMFFVWEGGSNGPGYIAHTPAIEADMFGARRNSGVATVTSSSNGTTSGPAPSIGSREIHGNSQRDDDDDDQDDDDNDAPITELHQDARQSGLVKEQLQRSSKAPQSSSSFFSRRSLAGISPFQFSGSKKETATSTPSQASATSASNIAFDSVPPSMQFGLIADCSLVSLPMTMRVGDLKHFRLRLCHNIEYRIFEQVQNIQSDAVQKEGIMTMFSRSKFRHRTKLAKFDGDIPFNPKRSMLGFNPMLCIRVAQLTRWSEPLDLLSGNFGAGGDYVSLQGLQYSALSQDIHYEFGAYAERGKGFYQNILCVSIVPKHIIVFKLSTPMQMRQLEDGDPLRLNVLKPGSIQNYHYPLPRKEKFIQLRRLEEYSSQIGNQFDQGRDQWFGEIDISHIGIVFVKLRNPLLIIKVQVEVVGASLIATVAPQDKHWPPYRIDNSSSLCCRFRQVMGAIASSTAGNTFAREQSLSNSRSKSANARSSKPGSVTQDLLNTVRSESVRHVPWDELKPSESTAYAWDYPVTGLKVLTLEFSQGPTWVGVDVSLDDVNKSKLVSLQRPLVGLSNPQAEGMLKFRDGDHTIDAYCILKQEVIYVFRDQSRDELVDVICLAQSISTNITARGPAGETTTLARRDTMQLASVYKYIDTNSSVFNSISKSIGYLSMPGNSKVTGNIDVNKARVLLLLLADGLGVFKTVPKGSPASKEEARERVDSHNDHLGNENDETNSLRSSKSSGINDLVRESAVDTDKTIFSLDEPDVIGCAPKITRRSMLRILSASTAADEEQETAVEETQVSGFQSDDDSREGPANDDLNIDDDDDGDDDDEDRSSSSSSVDSNYDRDTGSSLREQLQLGVPIDQLLEYISAFTFEMFDIVRVLEAIEEVSDKAAAGRLCHELVARNILVVSNAESLDRAGATPRSQDQVPTAESHSTFVPFGTVLVVNNENAGKDGSPDVAALRTVTGVVIDTEMDSHSIHSQESDTVNTAVPPTTRSSMFGIASADLMKPSTENLTMRTKLTFGIPSLFPELAALAAADDQVFFSAKDRMTMIGGIDENELNGFTIYRDESTPPVHFICGSESEFLGWIQSCRQNIEQVWGKFVACLPPQRISNDFDHVQRGDVSVSAEGSPGLPFTAGNIAVDNFKLKLNLKVRADGPTKVLEITELDSTIDRRIRSIVIQSHSSKTLDVLAEVNEDQSDEEDCQSEDGIDDIDVGASVIPDSIDGIDDLRAYSTESPHLVGNFRKVGSLKPTLTPQEIEIKKKREQLIIEQQHALFVSVKVESFSISLIDAEPAEVVFVNLRHIQMSVERTYHKLTIAATVHQMQVSNQLLKPAFPVALHPRKIVTTSGTGANARLRLPGLHHGADDEFPALHLFFQQKLYHTKVNDTSSIEDKDKQVSKTGNSSNTSIGPYVPSANSGADAVMKVTESNLMYFEMATVWLAPMELDIDEELVIRLMRFINVIRTSLKKPDMGSLNRLKEEILSIQHQGTKSWGTMDPSSISNGFIQLLEACKGPYAEFSPLGNVSRHLYFSLLQLHPLDIVMNLHPSPSFPITSSEMTIVSLLSQVDGARLCLNALITEHAFGSISMISDIIIKHYKACLWRQFHKLIGSTDIVEGSVGLVANLGSGVYDLFYEPIEGLLDENGSFLNGLSKGGRSLASRTIGGTSGFTSKITGGLGKGVSFLTMDSDFYRNRASRRLNKTTSVSEGIYVGTKELGKNIVEGVSGIVVSPYRGWEEGGGYGFGVGIAKGLLGVALKPAVGVFDLVSRGTEGIRHTAFGADPGLMDKKVVTRSRIPRSFGRLNILIPYNNEASAAQYLADKLIGFNRESRVLIVHHLHVIRSLDVGPSDVHPMKGRTPDEDTDSGDEKDGDGHGNNSPPLLSQRDETEMVDGDHTEDRKDITISTQDDTTDIPASPPSPLYLPPEPSTLRQSEALAKLRISSAIQAQQHAAVTSKHRPSLLMYKDEGFSDFRNMTEAWGMTSGNSYVILVSAYRITLTEVRSDRHSKHVDFRFIWSCPAACVDQLFGDSRGDLVISVGSAVGISGTWNSAYPVVLDFFAQDFVLFQSLLEQTIGPKLARMQPLAPSGGLIQRDLFKRYSTGLKSILLSPTKHTFQLFGYVLYEYTVIVKKKDQPQSGSQSGAQGTARPAGEDDKTGGDPDRKKEQNPDDSITREVGRIFARSTPLRRNSVIDSALAAQATSGNDGSTSSSYTTSGIPEGVLTYVYPLVDLVLLGPYKEDGGRYSLSLSRKDGARMRVLKRENAEDHVFEHHKSMLTIIFPDSKSAWKWRHSIEGHIFRTPKDVLPAGPLIPDKKKTILGSIAGSVIGRTEGDEPTANSILGMLVLPTAGLPAAEVEAMKVEIAKTLLVART